MNITVMTVSTYLSVNFSERPTINVKGSDGLPFSASGLKYKHNFYFMAMKMIFSQFTIIFFNENQSETPSGVGMAIVNSHLHFNVINEPLLFSFVFSRVIKVRGMFRDWNGPVGCLFSM